MGGGGSKNKPAPREDPVFHGTAKLQQGEPPQKEPPQEEPPEEVHFDHVPDVDNMEVEDAEENQDQDDDELDDGEKEAAAKYRVKAAERGEDDAEISGFLQEATETVLEQELKTARKAQEAVELENHEREEVKTAVFDFPPIVFFLRPQPLAPH